MPVLNPTNQFKTLVGTVVNAGQRARTVRVRIDEMKWNKRVQKYYLAPYYLLVRDTNRSTLPGDIIRLRSNWRVSKNVRHVLTAIMTPFGTPLAERPPVPTIDDLQAEYVEHRFAKDLRQAAKGREASAKRLLEYPAVSILEAVRDVNLGARERLARAWKRVIVGVPNYDGRGEAGEGVAQAGEVAWEVRGLLKELKPRIRDVLEDSRDETHAEKRLPINERLNRQGRLLVDINTLNNLVGRIQALLESIPSRGQPSTSSRSETDTDKELKDIREEFRKSLEPKSPHITLSQADLRETIKSQRPLKNLET